MKSLFLSDRDIHSIKLWLSRMKTPKNVKLRRKEKGMRAESILQLKYEMIGSGSHRIVYDLQNNYVLKIVISRKGFFNNRNEYNIYNNCPPGLKEHLCPVIEIGQGWIIMERMVPGIPMDEKYAEKLSQLNSKFSNYGITPFDVKNTNLALSQEGEIVVIDYGNFEMK
ncbi:hypothetical protein [Cytobacillus firmus]|uniref:hypothetical protein n=1 Tax=Cytobacillus firmus TaxID=1399 RepID=UPI00202E0E37|nr:hypothetical protein [Cytobacillus firmus]URT73201.1 hypothetical protein NAF01_12405 [Cytobacillus firmus]